jgi:hypothetical protein
MRRKNKLFGVALNDADYPVVKHGLVNGKVRITWRCPYYTRWYGMIRRCYQDKFTSRNIKYSECSVCDEWLTFMNFKVWMHNQDWKGKELDKDLICIGNKVY